MHISMHENGGNNYNTTSTLLLTHQANTTQSDICIMPWKLYNSVFKNQDITPCESFKYNQERIFNFHQPDLLPIAYM